MHARHPHTLPRLPSSGLPDEEVLSSFLHQYYREGKFIPDQILIPKTVPEQDLVERWLTELKGRGVRLGVPLRGDKKHLLKMACENAQQFLLGKEELEKDGEKLLEILKEKLHLRKVPWWIDSAWTGPFPDTSESHGTGPRGFPDQRCLDWGVVYGYADTLYHRL